MNTINIKALSEQVSRLEGKVGSIPVGKIPKDYSETEVVTGLKWIDNKDIYCKVITGTLGESEQTLDFVYDNVIYFYGSRKNTSLNRTYDLNRAVQIYFASGNNVVIGTASGVSGQTFILLVYYTKSASPSKGPDSEPDEVPEELETKKATRKKSTK